MPFIGILFFLVIWQTAVTILEVPTYLLPKPTDILETLISDFDKILKHAWVTSYEMLLGYLLAIISGTLDRS